MSSSEEGIVIVGGGICGLATALALHRKGLKCRVLERSESLRSAGAAIGIHSNGWRALDQLGVGPLLRQKSIRLQVASEFILDRDEKKEMTLGKDEVRCLKRSDLLEALASALPPQTIRFGCRVIDVKMGSAYSHPILELQDESVIKAKVLIGCDGVNSIVAEALGLKTPKHFSITGARGLTYYPDGHPLRDHFVRLTKNRIVVGRVPIDYNLLHWFVSWPWISQDSQSPKDPELILEAIAETVKDFPPEIIEMVKNSKPDALNISMLRYRSPWDILLGNFSEDTVTVAGDAMHVMGPFLGQGGSAGLEDAIVLSRHLARHAAGAWEREGPQARQEIGLALQGYVRERRMRVVRLSTQTYLMGKLLGTSWVPLKLVIAVVLIALFGHPLSHAHYDCGRL